MAGQVEAMRILFDGWGWMLPRSDGKWCSIKCSNHEDRHASARVHMDEGAFICMACGIHASSPVNLVMAVEGLDYKGACEYLEGRSIKPKVKGQKNLTGWRRAHGHA